MQTLEQQGETAHRTASDFFETLAGHAGAQLMAFVEKKWDTRDPVSFLTLRTRYLDDALTNRSPAIHQVVILASGMDACAFRLDSLADCVVWEFDVSQTMLDRKKRVLFKMQPRRRAKAASTSDASGSPRAGRRRLLILQNDDKSSNDQRLLAAAQELPEQDQRLRSVRQRSLRPQQERRNLRRRLFRHGDLEKLGSGAFVQYSGLTSAYLRAAESARDDRIIEDRFAEALAGDAAVQLMALAANKWGANQDDAMNLMAIRTRYLDEALAHRNKATKQVVVLAAGMDARAYRLDALEGCNVFELDVSNEILERKQRILREMSAHPIAHKVHHIAADLTNDAWDAALVACGFNPNQPTFWCLEGLLYFLDYGSNIKVLKTIDALSATGSQFWADLCGGAASESPLGSTHAIKYVEDHPRDGILSLLHWDLHDVVAMDQPGNHFGRDWTPMKKSKGDGNNEVVLPWYFVQGKKLANRPPVHI
ncbi:putative Omethyltransferase, partial [Globisporangium splendens]